jgi:hypothetical protein
MAGYQELFLDQGSDYSTTITLDGNNGQPFDLTNYTAHSQVRKSYYSSNTTATFTVSITNPTAGVVALSLNSANTANMAPGRYVYDVVISSNTNVRTRVLEGIVNVNPQVTVF